MVFPATKNISLTKGFNEIALDYTINRPTLWWTNGLGVPYLYDFSTTLTVDNEQIDAKEEKTGLRSLKLVTKPDSDGTTLYFELNGKPVFMKGANYIPCDNFLPRVTDSIYNETILAAKNANMNMLRVWGGGIYENDIFYDLCDKYGILVWQDFMFACSLYPGDDDFVENVRQEAICNVKRLRNHPSIALWCGNNENQDAWFGWGWKSEYEKQSPAIAERLWTDYQQMFFKVLPSVVEKHGSGISYRASSPMAFEDGKSDGINGDSHYWGVWHGNHPISAYNTERSRFFSEYGFQSFPEFESVKIYAPESYDHDIYSDVMMAHQRGGTFANKRIEEYMLKEYRKPKNFEAFLYTGMVLQGDAIKTAMEAHRRDMPYCMGTLFWQHNDCWPVASWASRDYYGRWKAQHYFAKKAYRDMLVSPFIHDGFLQVNMVSDRLKPAKGEALIQLMTLDGKIVFEEKKKITVGGNTSTVVFNRLLDEITKGHEKREIIIYTAFNTGSEHYENIAYPVKQKDMNYSKAKLTYNVKPIDNGYEVSIRSDKFARGVFLSLNGIDNFFEDNYVDILPGGLVTIEVKTHLKQKEFEKQLKIMSMFDSYM